MSKQNQQSIRRSILAAMRAQGISQRELGKRSGLAQTTVNRYCNAVRDMTGENLDKLLQALGLKISQ